MLSADSRTMDPTSCLMFVLTLAIGLYVYCMANLYALCLNAGEPVLLVSNAPAQVAKPRSKARPTMYHLPRLTGYARPTLLLAPLTRGEYSGVPMCQVLRHSRNGVIDCVALDLELGRSERWKHYRMAARSLGSGIGTVWGHS